MHGLQQVRCPTSNGNVLANNHICDADCRNFTATADIDSIAAGLLADSEYP